MNLFKTSIFSSRIFPFQKDRRVTILGAAGPRSKWLKQNIWTIQYPLLYGIIGLILGYIRINPYESLPPNIKSSSPETTPLDLRAPLFQCLLGSVRHDGGGVLRSDKLQRWHPKNTGEIDEQLWNK